LKGVPKRRVSLVRRGGRLIKLVDDAVHK